MWVDVKTTENTEQVKAVKLIRVYDSRKEKMKEKRSKLLLFIYNRHHLHNMSVIIFCMNKFVHLGG